MEIAGKVAVVTGGASGIGRGIGRALAARGDGPGRGRPDRGRRHRGGDFFIMSHPEVRTVVEARCRDVIAACDVADGLPVGVGG